MGLKVVQLRAVAAPRQRLIPSVIAPLVDANERNLPLDPVVHEISAAFGFSSFSFILTTTPRPLKGSMLYVYTTADKGWFTNYERERYVEVDPRLLLVEDTSLPVIWDEDSERGRSPRCDAFLADALAHGIGSGMALALNNKRQHSMVVMFNLARPRIDAVRRAMIERNLPDLVLFSHYFSDLFLHLCREDEPLLDKLTPRENEALHLVAQGLSGAIIGARLGVKERTVQLYLDNAKRKLGASNRQQAVATALKRGLIVVNG